MDLSALVRGCGQHMNVSSHFSRHARQVNVRPSVFAYAAPLTAEAATEVKKVEKAVLSTTARAKAKAKEKQAGKAKASNGARSPEVDLATWNACPWLSDLLARQWFADVARAGRCCILLSGVLLQGIAKGWSRCACVGSCASLL